MVFASVVVDIPTRALADAYDYAVPPELADQADVGCTVLVTFSGRMAVGYVVALSSEPPAGVSASRIRAIERVLAPSAFDEAGARVAAWMAGEYACPPCEAIRPFLAPGQTMQVRRTEGEWGLVTKRVGEVDDRWVSLVPVDDPYEPPHSASRQRKVLEALAGGPMRLAELRATVDGATQAVTALERRGVVEVIVRRRVRGGEATSLKSADAPRPEALTKGQREALVAIERARRAARGDVVLVDGVTGSGKTEVYLDAIERALAAGQGAIVLVPEISLTAQTVGRFRSRFGDAVAVLHSRLSAGERYDQWDLVRTGEARVVVGARSALFSPVRNPGLIIIDEEHEGSYKQDSSPRYHAREVAARMAVERGCALVLGSATPSLESLSRCEAGTWRGVAWTRVSMPERPGEATLPDVRIVDMTQQFGSGNRSIFSQPLQDALRRTVEAGRKAVLLHNRRGFANFLMCRECGCVPECPHCSTALTYHERTHALMCHTCGRSWPQRAFPDPSTACPNCGSRYLGAFGVGTQRVEDELRILLDGMGEAGRGCEVIRMDADTTRTKGAHQRLLERFDAADSAVLVGTQMIAKGLDFPEVSLVGVINADSTLKLPDFRAAERTYDLLEQVAGRAGRADDAGEVIVQTYWASHPAIQAVARHDRSLFVGPELADRREVGYPPFSRIANVIVWGRRADDVEASCAGMARELTARVGSEAGWEVLGPAECVRARAKDQHRRHVLVKAPPTADVGPLLLDCASAVDVPRGVSMALDVDAYDMM